MQSSLPVEKGILPRKLATEKVNNGIVEQPILARKPTTNKGGIDLAEEAIHLKGSVKSEGVPTSAGAKKITFVECQVTTPRAQADDTAANGVLQITVRNDLSPIASAVFLDLVEAQFYDGVFIFRVLKGFIAQWGFHNKWTKTTKPPKTKDAPHQGTLSNVRGTLSFAGGIPSVQQVFVNLGNNVRLDKEDSRPFATLSHESMEVLDKLYMEYKDGQGQIKALKEGEEAVLEVFPRMSKIVSCRVVPSGFST
jgi:cyclophilin family peptidyl-prolyl cis-trans isomerase